MLTPHTLARISDRCVAARLRGDRVVVVDLAENCVRAVDAEAFDDWLARYWFPDGPPEPPVYPDAVSFLGRHANQGGPRWYADTGRILGYLPTASSGCYRVPVDAVLPGIAHLPRHSPESLVEVWS